MVMTAEMENMEGIISRGKKKDPAMGKGFRSIHPAHLTAMNASKPGPTRVSSCRW